MEYAFCMQVYQWQGTPIGTANFGQKPFKFPPPDGFQPLTTANTRPETVISRPDQYVGISAWTGDGNTGRNIKDLNFNAKPDFVWIKSRSHSTYDHMLFDSVRGAGKNIRSNKSQAEVTNTDDLSSFDSNGFTVGSGGYVNGNGPTFIAWCWKAGGNKDTFNVDDVGYATAAAAVLDSGSIAVGS